ncbi:MAG: 4-(cytidine 5'-diphospho)-2-C-methyl-D-erythritol kinase [Alteromonadaceae bacterium]|nr:4-(cytidine 5'-diphospho)-2-C-methyl-D-erythritol kinase [Alteromonadaceae bacterium]
MSTKFYSFPSPAKLNLFLHINGQRSDGYHELQTLFQFLDHGDTIDISVNKSANINLLTPIKNVADRDNLLIKAALLLKTHTINNAQVQAQLGCDIKITKVLPMGGGLGGGSSNAATVLLALNKLWQLNHSIDILAQLGLKLGADVPVFVRGFAAFAEGVGEKLSPASPTEYWYLVSKPACSISTQAVFQSAELPRNTPKINLKQIKVEQCHNDCQIAVIKSHPEVANLLAWLVEYAPSRMTGTGACLFSRFTTKAEALTLQLKLPKGVYSFVAKGLNQSPLVKAIVAVN